MFGTTQRRSVCKLPFPLTKSILPHTLQTDTYRLRSSQDANRGHTDVAMSVAIKIMIADLPASEVTHRFRNSGVVGDICRHNLGLVTLTIKREWKRHHFDGSASLVRM